MCSGVALRLALLCLLVSTVRSDACIWNQCYRIMVYGKLNVTVTRLDFYKCEQSKSAPRDRDHQTQADTCVAPSDARYAIEVQSVMTNLSEIPRGLCSLAELETLSLQHNRIWTLLRPASERVGSSRSSELQCAQGSRLRVLDLRFNKLRTVDLRVLFSIGSLSEAWFDYNEIEHLVPIDSTDASSYRLSDLNLRVLSFRGNRLRTVDISLLQIVSLQQADLGFNRISKISNARLRIQASGESIEPSELQKIKNLRMIRGVNDEQFPRTLNVSLQGNDFSFLFEELRSLESSRHLYQGFSINFAEPSKNLIYMLIKYLKDFEFLSFNFSDASIRCDCSLFPTLSGLRAQVKRQSQFVAEVATIRRLINDITCENSAKERFPLLDTEPISEDKPVSLMQVDDSRLSCVRSGNTSSSESACPLSCTCVETPGQSSIVVDCSKQQLQSISPVQLADYIDSVVKQWRSFNQSYSSVYELQQVQVDLSGNLLLNSNFSQLVPVLTNVQYSSVLLNLRDNRLSNLTAVLLSLATWASGLNNSNLNVLLSNNRFACVCNDVESEALNEAASSLHSKLSLDVSLSDCLQQCSPSCAEQLKVSVSSSVQVRTNVTSTSTMRLEVATQDNLFVLVPNATVLLVVAALCTVCVLVLLFAVLTYHFYSKMKHQRRSLNQSSKLAAASCNSTPNNFRLLPAANTSTNANGVCVYQNIVNNVDMFSEVPHFATLRNPRSNAKAKTKLAANFTLPRECAAKRRVSLSAYLSQQPTHGSFASELNENAANRRVQTTHGSLLRQLSEAEELDPLHSQNFNSDITEV